MDGVTAQFVSAAEITRNFGLWQDRAAQRPLIVTHHGRPRVVMLSIADYDALAVQDPVTTANVKADARLSGVLDHLISGFVAFDGDLRFRRVNVVAAAYFERSEESLIGQSLEEAIPELRDGLVVSRLRHVIRTGEDVSFDAPVQLHDDRLMRFRLFPYPGGVAALFTNVAEQLDQLRDAAEQVSLSEARNAHGGVGIGRLNVRGTFAQVESSLAAMAGFDPLKLIGVRLGDLLALNRRVAAGAEIETVLSGGGPRVLDSVMLVNGGQDLPIRVALAEIREGFAVAGATVMITPLH